MAFTQLGRCPARRGPKCVGVQIGDGEAQIVVAPDQISVFEAVGEEFFLIEKSPGVRMLGITQERPEVDDLLGGVVELQTQAITTHMLGSRDVDDCWIHGSAFVIFSGETDLWRTK